MSYDPKPKIVVVDEDENPAEHRTSEADDRQRVRRAAKLSEMVTTALTQRIEASGPDVMKVTFDEFSKMMQDSQFEPFSKYAPNILNYSDGRPRPRPLRPFLEHEVGIWQGKIVCLANNPGDGQRTGVMVPVEVDVTKLAEAADDIKDAAKKIEEWGNNPPASALKEPLAVEADPFPTTTRRFSVVGDDK